MNGNHDVRDRRMGYALLRAFLGMNICLHGVSRLATGLSAFQGKIQSQFAHTPLPHLALAIFAVTLPWVEALLGFLILVGLFTRPALIGGASIFILLTFGSGLIQDRQAAGVELVYAIAYMLLLFFPDLQQVVSRYPATPAIRHRARILKRVL